MTRLSRLKVAAFAAAIALLGTAGASEAGDGRGRVGRIYAGPGQPARVFFAVLTTTNQPDGHMNAPACSTVGGEWVLNTSTPGGQQAYELLLRVRFSGVPL